MERDNGINAVPEHQVAPVPVTDAVDAAVVSEERQRFAGGDGGQGGVLVGVGGGEGELIGKRKRGRPRKQQVGDVRQELVFVAEPSASPQKRGRGRPRGSGKWQTLAASLGGFAGDSSGSKFTPHTLTIQTGENIVQRFCSFAQRASESLCILSASGIVSRAEIRQAGSGGGILRYEGCFEIITLSGSNLENVTGGVHGKICLLSVQLANPDGGLFGGAVAGSLIAGGPTQLVIATFKQNLREQVKAPPPPPPPIEPPRPNINVFATPLQQQQANGKFQEAEVNGPPASVSPFSAGPAVEPADSGVNGPDTAYHPSPPHFDWTSLHPSPPIPPHILSDVHDREVDHDQ